MRRSSGSARSRAASGSMVTEPVVRTIRKGSATFDVEDDPFWDFYETPAWEPIDVEGAKYVFLPRLVDNCLFAD
jgi:hypothetical protein